jgi:hypothetical protein
MSFPTTSHSRLEKTSLSAEATRAPSELDADLEKEAAYINRRPNEEIVDWDNAEDANNPQNFESRKKWTIIILVSAITFNQ